MAKFNQDLNEVLNQALNLALDLNHALCTTEHVLLVILEHESGEKIIGALERDDYDKLKQILKDYLLQYVPLKSDPAKMPARSFVLLRMLKRMYASCFESVGVEELLILMLDHTIVTLQNSWIVLASLVCILILLYWIWITMVFLMTLMIMKKRPKTLP